MSEVVSSVDNCEMKCTVNCEVKPAVRTASMGSLNCGDGSKVNLAMVDT
jgi:hypothetical protein